MISIPFWSRVTGPPSRSPEPVLWLPFPYSRNATVVTIVVVTRIIKPMNKERTNPPQRAPRREELVYLEIMRTADALSRGLVPLFKREKISPTQYNVLRILRGSPGGLSCGEIANRMITRDPDMTRLLDRMEKRSLIFRCRSSEDRRTVTATIAAAGRELLARLDEPLQAFHREQLSHMGAESLRQLARLLQTARG